MQVIAFRAATWASLVLTQPVAVVRRLWAVVADDEGLDEAPSKMIYLAVGVALAIAATLFIINTYNTAESNVPTPTAPVP